MIVTKINGHIATSKSGETIFLEAISVWYLQRISVIEGDEMFPPDLKNIFANYEPRMYYKEHEELAQTVDDFSRQISNLQYGSDYRAFAGTVGASLPARSFRNLSTIAAKLADGLEAFDHTQQLSARSGEDIASSANLSQ